MICPDCEFENPEDAQVCAKCGLSLATFLTPDAKVPSSDRYRLAVRQSHTGSFNPTDQPVRENYLGPPSQFIIMSCRVERSNLREGNRCLPLAPSIMEKVHEIIAEKANTYLGVANKPTGPRVLALFGSEAVDPPPVRAIRSAVAIQRKIARLNEETRGVGEPNPISMQIGVCTSTLAMDRIEGDLEALCGSSNPAVDEVVALEEQAESGAIFVSEDVFKSTRNHFRFEAMGAHALGGTCEAARIYRVLRFRTRGFDVPSEQGLTRFIGRDREMDVLHAVFKRAKSGRGQVLSMVGEAGVGKTRLLYEFKKAVANEEITFLEAGCFPHGRDMSYHPVSEILKSAFRILPGDTGAHVRDKVSRGLEGLGVPQEVVLPYILELLSVKDSGIEQIGAGPEEFTHRLMDSIRSITLRAAEIRPVVMVIEDFHWSDRSTSDLFNYVIKGIDRARVLLIVTYRPEMRDRWSAIPYRKHIVLDCLTQRETLRMAAAILGVHELDSDLEELILRKTRGVPFFVEEFIKCLQDLEIAPEKDGSRRPDSCVTDQDVTSTIQDVIMSRICSLPQSAREVLEAGSVVGREFSHPLISRVTQLPDYELLSRMSVLMYSGLVYERGTYPRSNYVFKHALIQDTCFESLDKDRRRDCHRKTAEVLEQHSPETARDHPETLAYHFTEAGFPERAIAYWQQAGEMAIRRSSNVEAVAHLNKALALVRELPESPHRSCKELELQIAIGPALTVVKGYTDHAVEHAYERSRELCLQLMDLSRLFHVLRGLCGVYMMRARLRETLELGRQCLALARKEGNPSLVLWSHHIVGQAATHLGDLKMAREHLEQGLDLYDAQKPRMHRALQDPGVACLAYMAPVLWLLGYSEQALRRSQEAVTLARELSHPFSLAYSLSIASLVCQFCRKPQECLEYAEAALDISTRYGMAYWLVTSRTLMALAKAELGYGKEGITQAKQALKAYVASGPLLMYPYWLLAIAELQASEAEPYTALALVDEARTGVEATEERWCEAELYRLRGDLLLSGRSSGCAEGEACLKLALDTARRRSCKAYELRAAMSLGRCLARQGREDEARELLCEVCNSFTEGFDLPDLRCAAQLMDGLV